MEKLLRTFIAIELEHATQERLRQIQEQLQQLDLDVKWVEPKNIHLTLKFLGDTPPKKLKNIMTGFPDFFKGCRAFEIAVTSLGAFPDTRHPRVIWAGIGNGTEQLLEIAQRLETGLCQCGIGKETREFSSHLTLGRTRSSKNLEKLAGTLNTFALYPSLQQRISKITLFQSTLTSHGPIYESLTSFELK